MTANRSNTKNPQTKTRRLLALLACLLAAAAPSFGDSPGRVLVADLSQGAPAQPLFFDPYGFSFDGWTDQDIQLAGDFMNLGYDQVMFINNAGSDGRIKITSLSNGNQTIFWHDYADDCQVCGWHNPGDLQLVGDFMGLGYDQVMFINNTSTSGRVLIKDFSIGGDQSETLYRHTYADDCQVCGWHDPGDLQLVGDFMGYGYDQVMFINRFSPGGTLLYANNSTSGRVMIRDFSSGNDQSEVAYWLGWQAPCQVCGWHDVGDVQVAGDFMGYGYDQVMFINRFSSNGSLLNTSNSTSGRLMIRDFRPGDHQSEVAYWLGWQAPCQVCGWHDVGDVQLAGDFMGYGYDQVLFINRFAADGTLLHAGNTSSGRVMIRDFSPGDHQSQSGMREDWGDDDTLDGWHDTEDILRVGDFMGTGKDQSLFINPTSDLANPDDDSSYILIFSQDFHDPLITDGEMVEVMIRQGCRQVGDFTHNDSIWVPLTQSLHYTLFTAKCRKHTFFSRGKVEEYEVKFRTTTGEEHSCGKTEISSDQSAVTNFPVPVDSTTCQLETPESTYDLHFSGQLHELLLDGGYEVMVRQGCAAELQDFTHNDSAWVPVTEATDITLTTAQCRKAWGRPRREVQEYEVKFRRGDHQISCGKTPAVTQEHFVTHYPVPVDAESCPLKSSLLTAGYLGSEASATPQQIVYSQEDLLRFTPSFRLCSSDPSLPVAVDDPAFLDHVVLRKLEDPAFLVADLTPEILAQYSDGGMEDPAGDIYYLESIDDTSLHGNPDLAQTPVYVRVKTYPTGNGETIAPFVDLQYIVFYGLSGSQYFDMGDNPFYWDTFAYHEGDWEHVTVRVTPDFSEILEVFYAGHGGGHWRLRESLELVDSTHPVVYVACHSHSANFEMGSVVQEDFSNFDIPPCVANLRVIDYTAESTVLWEAWNQPERLIELGFDANHQPLGGQTWLLYSGKYGPSRENGPVEVVGLGLLGHCLQGLAELAEDYIPDDLKSSGGPKAPPEQRWWREIE